MKDRLSDEMFADEWSTHMTMMIRYRVRAEQVEEHLDLLRAVFEEMAAVRPPQFRYVAHRLDDGVTFVDLVQGDQLPAPLPELDAFQRYRVGLDERCDEPPVMTELFEFASYPAGSTGARSSDAVAFTVEELDYLRDQHLGRLATVDTSGAPQNNPVGFVVDSTTGQLVIGGLSMGTSRKFRNVLTNPTVAFVVDDLASIDPWVPRGIEIRGFAEPLTDVDPPMPGFSREVIRITPTWVGTWGLQAGTSFDMTVRRAASAVARA